MDVRNTVRWGGVGLIGIALLCGGLALVLPWSESDHPGGDDRLEWGTFGGEVRDEDGPQIEWTWYDEYLDEDDGRPLRDHDGVVMLRVTVPLFVISLVGLLAGGAVLANGRSIAGGALAGAAGIVGLVAAILMAIAIGDFESGLLSGFASQFMETGAGQVLALVAMPLGLVGGLLGLASGATVRTIDVTTAPTADAHAPVESAPREDVAVKAATFRLDRRGPRR